MTPDPKGGGAALKSQQAEEWRSRAAVRLERAELIERHWSPISHRVLELAEIGEGDRVLDIGTGHGEPALQAAAIVGGGGRVVGVDLSPEMITAAEVRRDDAGLGWVEFVAQDAEALQLGDAAFDAVLARNSMMFLPNPELALRGFRQRLVPGGRAVVAVVGPEETQPQWNMTVDAIASSLDVAPPPRGVPGQPGVYSLSDSDLLSQLLERAGFEGVEVEAGELVYDFKDPQEVVTWHSINPTIMGLFEGQPETAREGAWAAVVEAAMARADADGHVRIPSQILYARGSRP
jgi:ubiquinone/menaquinone biosynthesis C-methylase UbiE